ncbi:glycosyltransferase [Lactobacillus sp. XV13L]|nr:glycosyltransferase [Lactobacillus sp. XV13L]
MNPFWQSSNLIFNFAFLILISYPILGGLAWFVGVLCYKFVFKHQQREWVEIPPAIEPFVTIMIPAHNEEVTIKQTIDYLMTQINYTNYEILVIDDYSTDQTPAILDQLQTQYPKLRVIHIEKNKGKAHAFNVGLAFAKGELILSNDADTIPEPDALKKYVNYFIRQDARNIAAVTANMDVQNRTKLIAKSQTVEFSSIVGIIKRTETGVFGGIYAYSGANTMYRKSALIDVGLFRQDRATEDISVAWDQQISGWLAAFAPDIMFYMNVPETAKSLYQQRKRWAKGGTEVWLTNFNKIIRHPLENIGRTLMFIDQSFSIIWSFFFWLSTLYFVGLSARLLVSQNFTSLIHLLTMALVFVCFEMIAGALQLTASLIIDDRGRKFAYILFAPLYMLWWWIINALTIVTTFIPAVKTIMGHGSGTWVSPERKAN